MAAVARRGRLDGFDGFRYVVTVQAVLLATAISALTLPVWWAVISKARGYDLVTYGIMNTVNAAVAFVCGTALALTIKRVDRRIVMIVCGLLMSASELLTIVVVQPYAFFAVRSINSAALQIAAIIAVVSLGYTRDPARHYGWFTTLQTATQAVGLFSIPLLAEAVGFSGLQGLRALPGIFVALLGSRLPPHAPEPVASHEESSAKVAPLRWAPAIPALCAFLAFGFYTNDFFAYSERFGNARGLGAERIGLILSVTTAAGLPASLLVSWLGTRFGILRPIIAGAMLGAGAALLLLNQSFGETGYWLSLLIFSGVWGLMLPYLLGLFAAIDPVGRLLIATQPIRAAVSTLLLAGLTAATAYGGLSIVGWLAAASLCLCPVFVAFALQLNRAAAVAADDRPDAR